MQESNGRGFWKNDRLQPISISERRLKAKRERQSKSDKIDVKNWL